MSENRRILDAAQFLDSPQAGALDGIAAADVRLTAQRFLTCAYDGVGKKPRLLDGDDLHEILCHLLPARYARKDEKAALVRPVLHAFLQFLAEREMVVHAYELQCAFDQEVDQFEHIVRTGEAHAHDSLPLEKQKPFAHRGDKVGRNDPCPCGSGKKFKKCCARLGS